MNVVEPVQRRCRGCNKTLLFAKTSEGKIIPLDLSAPVYKLETDMTGVMVAVRVDAYVTHFASCPKADEFSKGKKA